MYGSEQVEFPCVIMRSGTSKGIYLHEKDLPSNGALRDKVILSIFGSPDPRQIDGLGGADILTSKLAIVGPSTHDEADVDYTFGQVVIDRPLVQYGGLCGNISAGVGPFAIEQGIVPAVEPYTNVRIFNTNTSQIFEVTVPVKNGKPCVIGDYEISGVPGSGAKIDINMAKTVGSATGKLLPTGHCVDSIIVFGKTIKVSVVDVVNPCIFVRAHDIGLIGVEAPPDMENHEEALDALEEIRRIVAGMIGFSTDQEKLDSDARPMIVFVAAPQDYENYLSGAAIAHTEHDFHARCFMISSKTRSMHQAFPGSISVVTGVASRITGTVVNDVSHSKEQKGIVRIGHPLGSIDIDVELTSNNELVRASYSRTARRIMAGNVYVPNTVFEQ